VDAKQNSSSVWRWFAFCLSITVLVGFSSEPLAVAAPSITFEPLLTVGGRWDSNFYQTEEDESEAYTYLVSPGLSVDLQGARSNVILNYMMEAHFYDGADGDPTVDSGASLPLNDLDYTGHQLSLDSNFDLTSRLILGLDGAYFHSRYPTQYDRLSTQILHHEYDLYHVSPMLFFDITQRLTAGLRYRHSEIDLEGDDDLDPVALDTDNTDEDLWEMTISYTPWRDLTMGLDLEQAEVDYSDRIDDYEAQRIRLRVQKRYPQIALDAGVGFENRDFMAAKIKDEDLFTWRLGLTAQAPDPMARPRSLGEVYIRPVDHVHFAVERQFNNIGSLYTATRFVGSVGSMWGEKIESRVKGWYQESDYEYLTGSTPEGGQQATRDLETWDVSASLGYHIIRNLVISATGGYREQESNLVDEDYTDTYGLIEASFNFDPWKRGGFTNEALYY